MKKKTLKALNNNKEKIVNISVLLLIFALLLSYFTPDLLLSETTTSGGDTASDYYPAKYLKDYLLPHGKIVGWSPGWYAGFPLFQFYFPLLFVIMTMLSFFIPLEIAFKLLTVLGTFLLPLTTFLCFRIMRFKFPMPIIAATFTLAFLFMEANSMWGGNIPSTLAGEFSHSFSIALAVLFLGLTYRGIEEKKYIFASSALLSLIILSHVYSLLFVAISSLFFLIEKKRKKIIQNFYHLFKVYFLTFLLTALWTIPLLANLPFTTTYDYVWAVSLAEIFPEILLPFAVLAIGGLVIASLKKEKRILYIAFSILSAFFLYLIASKIGVVDIRFVPFIQLFILFIAAYLVQQLTVKFKARFLVAIIVFMMTIFWVNSHVTYIDTWIKWNYEGFENKPLWDSYYGVNAYLSGNESDARVVYEHSPDHNSAGTVRAFESLPLFSGRSTLEGLYMQSTLSSPFVFYIQSEISKVSSCPLPGYSCSPFDLESGIEHLRMFNVKHIIAVSDKLKQAAKENKELLLLETIGPYEVYEIKNSSGQYVTLLDYEPVRIKTDDWKNTSYEWFKASEPVHLVFSDDERFLEADSIDNLPKISVDKNCSLDSKLENEKITISTTCIGKPLMVKVSYYPSWQVEGAEKIYLISPSFMLIYPESNDVTLYYANTAIDYIGLLLSVAGIAIIIYFKVFLNHKVMRFLKR